MFEKKDFIVINLKYDYLRNNESLSTLKNSNFDFVLLYH